MLLDVVIDMTPETLVARYDWITSEVENLLIDTDTDVTQIDAMNVDNWEANDPEDIWMRLAGIHDALDIDCEHGGYFEDVTKAYNIHMDKFRIASPSYVGAA